MAKNLLVIQETWVQSLGQEDPLEKEMATGHVTWYRITESLNGITEFHYVISPPGLVFFLSWGSQLTSLSQFSHFIKKWARGTD